MKRFILTYLLFLFLFLSVPSDLPTTGDRGNLLTLTFIQSA
jgi:hypothetical protein